MPRPNWSAARGMLAAALAGLLLPACSQAWRPDNEVPLAALAFPGPPGLVPHGLTLVAPGMPPAIGAGDRARLARFARAYLADGTGPLHVRLEAASPALASLRAEVVGSLARAGVGRDHLVFVAPVDPAGATARVALAFHALPEDPACAHALAATTEWRGWFAPGTDDLAGLQCARRRAFAWQLDDARDLLRARRETPQDPRRRVKALGQQPAGPVAPPPVSAAQDGANAAAAPR